VGLTSHPTTEGNENVELKLTRDSHERVYRVAFATGELADRPMPYSRTRRIYAPVAATVEVRCSHDNPWTVYSVELSGRAIKKDGKPGLQDATERFWNGGGSEQPQPLKDAVAAILAELNGS
jgi:hypothetical protein